MLGIRKGNLFFYEWGFKLVFVSLDEYYDLYTNGFVFYNWNNKKRLVLLPWYVFDNLFFDLSFLEYELGVFNIDIFQGNDIFVYGVRKN